jgi:hypothetical protein
MSQVNNSSPPPSYHDEFKRSVDLFEQSLQQYQKADGANIQAKFKEVMDKTSRIMDQTAPEFLSDFGQKKLQTLQSDYKNFSQNSSSAMMKKLQTDINSLKKEL